MIAFDNLPSSKPSQNASINPGRYLAVVKKAEMVESKKNPGTYYLAVTFITKDKEMVTENYFDDAKPFLQYKIGRLLKATGIKLEGTGSLNDIAKLLPNKKVVIDVEVNDKGYAGLDFSDSKEGIYARDEVVTGEIETEEAPSAQPVLNENISDVIASEDEDF